LSRPRLINCANHLIVLGRLCTRDLQVMSYDDVREFLIKLKSREGKSICWTRSKGRKYADHPLSDIKSILILPWRWMERRMNPNLQMDYTLRNTDS
jgi:hypothetical protein